MKKHFVHLALQMVLKMFFFLINHQSEVCQDEVSFFIPCSIYFYLYVVVFISDCIDLCLFLVFFICFISLIGVIRHQYLILWMWK
jgi:hypothetical protein